uniref:GLOBIN domain-containing protein n=1 Tax=Panagrellus redivivus TaxID=6233 RepID=A0A7E5A241_PANRE
MDSGSGFRRTQSLRYPKSATNSPNSLGVRRMRPSFRSRSSKGARGETSTALARMTPQQRQALVSSWRGLRGQTGPLMRKIFTELEIVSPKVKDIFYKAALVECFVQKEPKRGATMDDHIKLTVSFFDDIIANIENEAEVINMIKHVGQQHAILQQSCAFRSDIWESVGEIAVEKICMTDSVQKTREAARAWRSLIAFVTDELRCGFEGEAKAFSRRNSAEQIAEESPDSDDMIRKLQKMRLDYTSTVPMG